MTEHEIQATFISLLGYTKIQDVDLVFAIPNGGQRHPAVAAKLKAEGVKAGMPDVAWPVARGGFIGLAIEFKAATGKPTQNQIDKIDALQRAGWFVTLCWSADAAVRTVKGYAGMMELKI